MKKIIVIGASAASIAFIAKLRSFDTISQVICFSGEKKIPYNRCFLANFIEQDKDFNDIALKSENFFQEHAIDLRLNSWVTEINKEQKFVVCNGQQESYDYLFIGIGTSAYIPKIKGVDLSGVFGFHTFADVDKLDCFIQDQMPKTAVVVGAGINGVEAASALASRGLQVYIVDVYDAVMPMQVDEVVAQFIQVLIKQSGVTFLKKQKVVELQTRNKATVGRVLFESGACLSVDCVVFATGSRVNSALITQAGLQILDGSVVVNTHMQTSDSSIFAGGDVCIAPDIVSKKLVKSCTWSDAMLQGLIAATQLSTAPRLYPGVVGLRDSKFFGLEFYACGQTVDVELFTVIENRSQDFIHRFYMFDGRLQGFVLLGSVEHVAKYKTLYLTQKQVELSNFIES